MDLGMKRMALRAFVPGYSTVRKIGLMKKHGFRKGAEIEANELMNDIPGVSHIYREGQKQGRYEGKKEGYVDASTVYEKKLREQAAQFLSEKSAFSETIDGYEALLDELQFYIKTLERKETLSKNEEADLDQAIKLQNSLEASHRE